MASTDLDKISAPETGPDTGPETARAVRHMALVWGGLVLLAGLSYVVPNPFPNEIRPWVQGDPLPFTEFMDLNSPQSGGDPGIAAPSSSTVAAGSTEELSNEVAETLALTEDEPDEFDAPEPPVASATGAGAASEAVEPTAEGPGPGAEIRAEPEKAQPTDTRPSMGAAPEPLPKALRISTSLVEGVNERIVNAERLDPLFAKLVELGSSPAPNLVRLAHWGDSTIALDGITHTVRRRMQKRFGDAGHGFVLGGKGNLPYMHKDVKFRDNKSWKLNTITRGGRSDGRYGYGGTLFRAISGAKSTYETSTKGPVGQAVSRFLVYYQEHARGGELDLIVDGAEPIVVNTRVPEGADSRAVDRVHRIDVEPGEHKLVVKAAGHGESRVYGVALENGDRGLIYDSLGIVGARASRLLNFDAEHLVEQFALRTPDLIVLQFGGNESVDTGMSRDWYYKKLTTVVAHVRAAAPQGTPCLLMAPLDQGEKDQRGRMRTKPVVLRIVDAQIQVAEEQGCAYWNTFEAMGGKGSMAKWYRSKPRLASSDLAHATPKGYEVLGTMFYRAMMAALADYLERVPPGE